MYVPYGNLTKTGSLLQSVYDQLDVYRGQLVDQGDGGGGSILKSSYHLPPSPTVSSTSASSSSSSNYLLLYSAVQQLAQKLSTAATSAVYNYTDITAIPYSPSSSSSSYSSSYSTISPFSPTLSPSLPSFSTVDDLFTSSSSTSSPFTLSPSSFSPSITSITTTTTTTTASSIWTTFMQSLPMPTDEATLVSELGLGPVRDPLYTAIPMTLLYVLILVTGVIGNLVTCVVIARNRYMHTATNYYLFSLAISDLLLLILGLPQEIQQIWRRYPYAFSEAFCILRGFSSEASTNSSVLTITAFTVERYVAICHPLRAHTMSKLTYKFGIVFDYVHEEVLIPQSATCNVKRALPAFIDEHIFALQSLLVFVLPVTAISVLYVLIGLKLRQSSLSAKGNLGKLRRRPVKHKQGGDNTANTENAGSGKPSALEKTASYFTSTSTESIENMTPPAVLKNGGGQSKNGNGVANHHHHQGHLFNSNHNSNSNHRTLKEVANHFISQAHHHHQQQQHQLSNGAQYIVHDHRQRGRLTKFTSSSSSASSGGGGGCGGNGGSNSLSQRRQVIKMLR
ncbi:7 transmembrane receptor (rhodopsin) [Tyrophagus putrescentiae]|nr:7 transmembrane receptor (rhodopsin) [Tyrophagus putrescentiae]